MSIFYKDERLTHMQKGDAYLWSKFCDAHPNFFTSVKYDVRVGEGVTLKGDEPDWLKKAAQDLSKKRIDVVGETTKATHIIEVRVKATAAVLGTLLAYRYLYITSYGQKKPVTTMLITDSVDADLLIALNEVKVPYYIV
jgi:hypothetical protein